MKLFSHLLHTCQRLLQMLAIVPLLAMSIPGHAEEDIDSRERSVEFSQAQLDQILAPIALYPDTVLSQVLIASTYPIEVVQAARWASNNSHLKGADAVAKVENKDWDPSVKALVAFPDILQRMSDDIDWTQKLGDAFLSDEERVMDSIQSLRKKAYASGNLNKVEHLKVERDHEQIIIEPAVERVVYVPVYDTRVVYGNWWWPEYPPVYWHHPTSYVHVSGFYWGPSIYIGPTFFYSSCHWRTRRVVVVDHHHSHGSRPAFYTSRSIVNYHNARTWRHEPVHRRGVAYYNNDLRTRYGSQRESYRDARVYREERREQRAPIQRVYNDKNYNHPRTLKEDRSEQLRERLHQRNSTDSNAVKPMERAGIDNRNQGSRPLPNPNNSNRDQSGPRQQDINSRGDHINNRGVTRTTQTEQDIRARLRTQGENPDSNNLGANRPTLVQPERSQLEREQRTTDIVRSNREASDERNTRQVPTERLEQRQQLQERPIRQERQERIERQDSHPRGGRSDEQRQNRLDRTQ